MYIHYSKTMNNGNDQGRHKNNYNHMLHDGPSVNDSCTQESGPMRYVAVTKVVLNCPCHQAMHQQIPGLTNAE